jgi:hypothetical protein
MHSLYRKVCNDLVKFPLHDTSNLLEILHRYSLIYLRNNEMLEHLKANPYLEKKKVSKDLRLFLDQCERLLMSTSSSIIMEVANIFLDFPEEKKIEKVSQFSHTALYTNTFLI